MTGLSSEPRVTLHVILEVVRVVRGGAAYPRTTLIALTLVYFTSKVLVVRGNLEIFLLENRTCTIFNEYNGKNRGYPAPLEQSPNVRAKKWCGVVAPSSSGNVGSETN